MPSPRRPVRVSAGVLVVGLVAIAVRLPGVWSRPFWEDEVASARVLAEPTLGGMLHQVTHTESTPPLWYFLGWVGRQAGVGYPSLRLLSVLAGGILAVLVVLLARRFVAEPLALAAGLLTAFASELVRHGHELRAYELAALVSALFGLRLIAEIRAPSRRNEVFLAATVAAGGLTHYFFAFSLLAALIWLGIDGSVRAVRGRAVVAILCGGVIAAACAPMMLRQLHQNRYAWIGGFRARSVAAVPLRLFTAAFSQSTTGLVLSLTAFAIVAFGCARLARRSAEGRMIAFLALGPLIEAAAFWGAGLRIFDLRNLIGIGAFLAVAVVVAVDSVPARLAPVLAAGLVACTAGSLVALGTDAVPPFDRIAVSLVHNGWRASTPIAVFGDPFRYRGPLGWYLPRQPHLRIEAAHKACAPVLVIDGSGAVERLRAGRILHGATLLVQSPRRSHCVRRHWAASRAGVPILMYHVIAKAPRGAPFPGLYVPADEFAAQVHALARAGFHGVTLDQVARAWRGGGALPRKPVVLTFDNGYRTQFTRALPILRRVGWVADENMQLSGLPPAQGGLGNGQIRALVRAGWELDTQGFSHADLPKLDTAQLRFQIATARRTVQHRYHVRADWFCYPSGRYDASVIAVVKAAGYVGSTTVLPGWAKPRDDPYRLPRLRVLGGMSPRTLLGLIAGTRNASWQPGAY